MKKLCTRTVESANSLGFPEYFPCDKPVKFKVEYIDSFRSENKNEMVCGVHCNSIKKWAKRVSKLFDFDAELKVTPI